MKTDSHEFLTLLQSQIRVSSLERYEGEPLMKFQSLLAPSNPSSLLQILYFALYRLSNNLLLEYETDKFLRWLIEHQQNELLVLFLKTQTPTVHACATKILESALRIGDDDFLQLLISSGIDLSPLKGVYGGRHLIRAACENNLQIAQILLNNGADVNTPASREYPLTALQKAASITSFDLEASEDPVHMVQFLLETCADIDTITTFSNKTLRYPKQCVPTGLTLFVSFLMQAQILTSAHWMAYLLLNIQSSIVMKNFISSC